MDVLEFARNYLAKNAAESGADEIIRQLCAETERLREALTEIADCAWTDPKGNKVCRTYESVIACKALGMNEAIVNQPSSNYGTNPTWPGPGAGED